MELEAQGGKKSPLFLSGLDNILWFSILDTMQKGLEQILVLKLITPFKGGLFMERKQ